MPLYKCPRCGYLNHNKSIMRKHLQRQYICAPTLSNISRKIVLKKLELNEITDEFDPITKMSVTRQSIVSQPSVMTRPQTQYDKKKICNFCGTEFTTRQSKWTHVKSRCRKKKELLDKKEKLSVMVNPYNKPDHSHLTDEDYLAAIKKGNLGIPHIIEQIHFNKKKKDNYNLYISNKKDNYIDIYDGNRWIKALCDETIYMMIEDNMNIIEDKIEYWKENDPQFYTNNIEVIEKFPRLLDKYSSRKYVTKKIYEETRLKILNHGDVIANDIDQRQMIDEYQRLGYM